ncbi:hypothetical protein C8R47DRAFT_1247132 [Mycena vitilis]|nr:hypothetical protein C8R47DRAFT_1247132 [Mycena vitilis]
MSHFNPNSFAQNQPQAPPTLGRGERPNAETPAYTAHRAEIHKNQVSGALRTDSRRRNELARSAAAIAPPTATTPLDMQPPPLPPFTPQRVASANYARSGPQSTHGLAKTPSTPLHSFPPRGSASMSAQANPRLRLPGAEDPEYPDFQGMRANPPLRLPGASEPVYPDFQGTRSMLQDVNMNFGLDAYAPGVRTIGPEQAQSLIQHLHQQGFTMPPLNTAYPSSSAWGSIDVERESGFRDRALYSPDGTHPVFPASGLRLPPEILQVPVMTTGPRRIRRRTAIAMLSSLTIQMQEVPVHQKRKRRQRRQAVAAAPPSDSEGEQPPPRRRRAQGRKKRAGRVQPSRSIGEIPVERQRIVKAAYPLIQQEIVCVVGWPADSPSGLACASDDEANNVILDSWDKAHETANVPYLGDPTTPEKKLVRSRIPTPRLAFKKAAERLVASHYDLTDPQTLANPSDEELARVIEANRKIVAEVEHSFYYLDPSDPKIPNTMYRHAILQCVFNIACFGVYANRRGHYFIGLDSIPLPTLALIVTAVACALHGWKTGRFVGVPFETVPYAEYYDTVLGHLKGWVPFCGTQDVDVAGPMLKEMLRIARASSATVVPVAPAQDENVFRGFSASAYATNQPAALTITS